MNTDPDAIGRLKEIPYVALSSIDEVRPVSSLENILTSVGFHKLSISCINCDSILSRICSLNQ